MLLRGPSGHPLHPPFTDAAVGAYTVAAALVVVGGIGWVEDAAAKGAWLALCVGLVTGAGAAVTGFAELLWLDRRPPIFRTALLHMSVMIAATALFGLAAILQFDGFHRGVVTTAALVTTLVAYVVLVAGGWLGGTIVFVHGMRVMSQPLRPTRDAIRPRHGPLGTGAASRGARERVGTRGP
jgi:uncharacterized membrane protein